MLGDHLDKESFLNLHHLIPRKAFYPQSQFLQAFLDNQQRMRDIKSGFFLHPCLLIVLSFHQ